MKNIFERAIFGDKFITRGGRMAIYLWGNYKDGHSLMIDDGSKIPHHYNDRGKWYSHNNGNIRDIVGKWHPCISEKELDKLAYKAYYADVEAPYVTDELDMYTIAFKAGVEEILGRLRLWRK